MEAELYAQVKKSIRQTLHLDLEPYKDEQMRRRLDSWLIRSRLPTWQDYFRLLAADPTEQERLRNYLTINVTEFLRDPARWETLRLQILPALQKNNPSLQIWSAGCSNGAEAYSLAILMAENAPGQPYSLLATDIDRGVLQKAMQGGPYSAEDVHNLSERQRQLHLQKAEKPPYAIQPRHKAHITFREQNLLTQPFETGFDLILCRNVVIYFTAEAKHNLYQKFSQALRPGGVLFVGGTEILPQPAQFGLRNFGISFYQKT